MTTKITNANITNTGVSAGSYTNTNLTVNAQGQITAASNGTGGGGTPGGSDTQVQYNNAGAFGGISNATTDGTTLSMTSPKVITGINDTNGNELLKVTATASAVNELTLANAATGGNPVLSATGGDTNIGITLTPKGTGGVVFPAGAVGTPAITTTGDTNTGVFFPAADTAAITTGGSERMRVDSSGNIQIATTSNPLLWYNSTTTGNRFRIEQNGTPSADAYVTQGLVRNSSEEQPAIIGFAKSRGTTAGSATIVNNNDWLGMISFQGADGTNYVEGARIDALVDGTPGANDMPTRLAFLTTADGASSPTERMRINADGTIKTGSTISVGGATPSTSGAGITFPSTDLHYSTNANTLDDYEEGTWTPTCSNGSTYSGTYTKIGRIVHLFFETSSSGTITANSTTLSGLPFTPSGSQNSSGSGTYVNITSTAAFGGLQITTSSLYFVTSTSSAALRGYHCYYA